MAEDDPVSDEEQSAINEFDEFVDDSYPKFALIGIVGTVSAVLSSDLFVSASNNLVRFGVALSLLVPLAVTIRLSLTALDEMGDVEGIPNLTHIVASFGYASVAASAVGLTILIGSALSEFPQWGSLTFEAIVFLVLMSYWIGLYPSENVPMDEDTSKLNRLITIVSLAIGTFAGMIVTSSSTDAFGVDVFDVQNLELIPVAIMILVVFSLVRESLIGVVRAIPSGILNFPTQVRSPWMLRTSLCLATFAVSFLSWRTFTVANRVGATNVGYYQNWGSFGQFHSIEVLFVHWCLLALVFGVPIVYSHIRNSTPVLLKRFGSVVAVVIVLLVAMEVLFVLPHGSYRLIFHA
jgi:hypothetical protein